MKHVAVKQLYVKNFRSFVKPTGIKFTDTAGLKLVSGSNLVEPALGANGAGKSTVFDALVFTLYGTSVRGLRGSDLVTHGKKTVETALVLAIDDKTCVIERTVPPPATGRGLLVDGEPAEQRDVDQRIGLSKERFLQAVLFGQGAPLFCDLPVRDRGDLLSEVLDLDRWERAAERAGEIYRRQQAELAEAHTATERVRAQLENLPDTDLLELQEREWEDERDGRLREYTDRQDQLEAEIAELKDETAQLHNADNREPDTHALDKLRDAQADIQARVAGLQAALTRAEADAKFLVEHDTCPQCGQKIGSRYRHDCHERYRAEAAELHEQHAAAAAKLRETTQQVRDLAESYREALRAAAEIDKKQAVAREKSRQLEREAESLRGLVERTRRERNPYTPQKEETVARRAELNRQLDSRESAEAEITAAAERSNYWRQGFRRVRTYSLGNVLDELTLETRNALLALGLADWQLRFTTHTETKAGTQRLGVQLIVQPPNGAGRGEFAKLSGGEGQRARLAASIGLANLVQRWAGVRWSLEIWDEPTAWLSEQGVEDLLDALAERADAHGKSIYIADHRSLLHGGFAESYRVTKDREGSRWERA